MTPDQCARVLDALLKYPEGICATDFTLPNVIDGGPPILRVPARIGELEQRGHTIVRAGRRNKCQVYRLVADPPQQLVPMAAAKPEEPRLAIFDWDEAA